MGDKVTVDALGTIDGSSFSQALNNNLKELGDEFDKVLYRDGSQTLTGDLDANSKRILNLPAPQNNSEPLRLADVEALTGNVIITDNSVVNNITNTEAVTFSNGARVPVKTYFEASAAAIDLTEMEGYAATSGVVGGNGKTIYWISEPGDSATTVGTVRWALAQATANGGGLCIVSPYGEYHVRLTSTLVIPDNTTLDAPARNLHFYVPGDFVGIQSRKKNFILRRFSMERIGGQVSTPQQDLISILPRTSGGDEADKFWINQITFRNASDGAIDVAASLLSTTQCRGTIDHNRFIDCGKTVFIGSTYCTTGSGAAWCNTALAEVPTYLVTFHHNVFDCCAQRMPRVGTLAFVHAYNNLHTIVPHNTDDGTVASGMGAYVVLGGKYLSENEYYRAGYGSGYIGVNPESGALTPVNGGAGATLGQGAAKVVGSQSEDAITLNQLNTASVPVPPYTYTLESIPGGAGPLATWLRSIEAGAGSELDTAPEGIFQELPALGSFYPDGTHVVLRNDKYYARIDEFGMRVPLPSGDSITLIALPRNGSQTIASDSIVLDGKTMQLALVPETGTTDDLINITGATLNGQLLVLRSNSAANTITVKSTGNIRLASNADITDVKQIVLTWDSNLSLWKEISRTNNPHLNKVTWTADTGTAKRTANATYSGTAEVTYTQATIQTLMNAVRDLSQTVKAMKDDLIA
jgi:pectate lyase